MRQNKPSPIVEEGEGMGMGMDRKKVK